MNINLEAGSLGVTLNIGTARVRLDRDDAAILHELAAGPDGNTWTQGVIVVAEGSTVRTVLVHRHGPHVTIAIGLDDHYAVGRTTAAILARTMHDVTAAGAR